MCIRDRGTTTVTAIANDGNGQTDACTFNVVVVDNEGPTAICQDITVSLGVDGMASITASQIDNGSSDPCGAVSLSLDESSFDCDDLTMGNSTQTLISDASFELSTDFVSAGVAGGWAGVAGAIPAAGTYTLPVTFNSNPCNPIPSTGAECIHALSLIHISEPTRPY